MKKILPIIAVFLASILLVSCFSNVQGSSNSTDSASNLVTTESTGESKTSSESEPNEEITSPASTETEEEATSNSNFESGEDSSTYVITETEVETTSGSNLEYSEDSSSSDTTENATTEENPYSDLSYAAFGDSITYGADYTKQYMQMDYPYPSIVASLLELCSFNNYGISGSTIATNVDSLPSIYDHCLSASYNADIISILGGVNDYNRSVELGSILDTDTSTFYGSLKAICEILLDKYPDAFIFFMTPYKEDCYHEFSCTQPNAAGYNLEDYANAIKKVAAEYNIPVLDMYTYGQYELEMYNADSDGIHPSQEFIREYTAPQIAEFIRQNYRGK